MRVVAVNGFRLANVDEAGLEVVVVDGLVNVLAAGAEGFGFTSPAAFSVVGETFAEVTLEKYYGNVNGIFESLLTQAVQFIPIFGLYDLPEIHEIESNMSKAQKF